MSGRYDRRHRIGGPWLYGTFLVVMAVGAILGPPSSGPSEAEQQQQEDCAGVRWHDGMDREGWNLLLDSGYTERGGRLRPPGCESVR